jgi:Mn2+/Fe2+ NRAMP family transporter
MHPSPPTGVAEAPTRPGGIVRQLGPGLIISSIIVGSGELIVTPKLGAEAGFQLLWFIVLGCFLKVFVQIEFGRYAVLRGRTTLEGLNTLPGPRWIVSWVLWIWFAVYLAMVFQVAGIVGGVAKIFELAGVPMPLPALAVGIGASCAALLLLGRYRLVESLSTVMVALFVAATLVAVFALQRTSFAITGAQLAEGFSFELPDRLVTMFGAFGIIGVGASELIYYPYWCLEKGYAVKVGPDDGTPEWTARAQGWLRIMRIDAWLSFAVYTTTTLAFYLLGAAILHARKLEVQNSAMIETLSMMYRDVFGEWSFPLFLVGAFAVLFSTIFGGTASNARLLVDSLRLVGLRGYRDAEERARLVKLASVGLAVAFTTVFILWQAPVTLVFIGAVGQGVMLPFLGLAAVYFHFTNPHRRLRAGPFSLAGILLAAGCMAALGIYQVVDELGKRLG